MTIKYDWTTLIKILGQVFVNPLVLALSLLWGFLALGIILWLPNIELIRLAFYNETLSLPAKFGFLLEMYHLLFSVTGFMQAFLMITFTLVSCIGFGLFWTAMSQIHKGKITNEQANKLLLTTVLSGGLAMIGLIFLTPVVTVSGLIFGTYLHLFGMLLSITGIGLLAWSIHKLTRLVGLDTPKLIVNS